MTVPQQMLADESNLKGQTTQCVLVLANAKAVLNILRVNTYSSVMVANYESSVGKNDLQHSLAFKRIVKR